MQQFGYTVLGPFDLGGKRLMVQPATGLPRSVQPESIHQAETHVFIGDDEAVHVISTGAVVEIELPSGTQGVSVVNDRETVYVVNLPDGNFLRMLRNESDDGEPQEELDFETAANANEAIRMLLAHRNKGMLTHNLRQWIEGIEQLDLLIEEGKADTSLARRMIPCGHAQFIDGALPIQYNFSGMQCDPPLGRIGGWALELPEETLATQVSYPERGEASESEAIWFARLPNHHTLLFSLSTKVLYQQQPTLPGVFPFSFSDIRQNRGFQSVSDITSVVLGVAVFKKF